MAERTEKVGKLSPFERFQHFMRAIVAVPKGEIEQQEAKYRQESATRKRLRTSKGASKVQRGEWNRH